MKRHARLRREPRPRRTTNPTPLTIPRSENRFCGEQKLAKKSRNDGVAGQSSRSRMYSHILVVGACIADLVEIGFSVFPHAFFDFLKCLSHCAMRFHHFRKRRNI